MNKRKKDDISYNNKQISNLKLKDKECDRERERKRERERVIN